jgi:hypothetical protein
LLRSRRRFEREASEAEYGDLHRGEADGCRAGDARARGWMENADEADYPLLANAHDLSHDVFPNAAIDPQTQLWSGSIHSLSPA